MTGDGTLMPQEQADAPEPPVLVGRAGGIVTITLNRPSRLNAFTAAMLVVLRDALEQAAADEACRVVVIKAAGRAFSTGQDLAERVATPGAPRPDLGHSLDTYYNPMVRLIRGMEKPVIAAVNGVAAGAGANFALACDIVIAARSASFAELFTRIGLLPDCGGTWILPRLIGEARARAITILADPVTASQAADWGMIWKAIDDDALDGEVDAIASRLAKTPRTGLALLKRALLASSTNSLDAQLDLERDLQRIAGFAPAYAEAVAAFVARKPSSSEGKA